MGAKLIYNYNGPFTNGFFWQQLFLSPHRANIIKDKWAATKKQPKIKKANGTKGHHQGRGSTVIVLCGQNQLVLYSLSSHLIFYVFSAMQWWGNRGLCRDGKEMATFLSF